MRLPFKQFFKRRFYNSKAHLARELGRTNVFSMPFGTRTSTAPNNPQAEKRALIAGWFTFKNNKATFGDSRAMEVTAAWLHEAGIPFDVVGEEGNRVPGVSWETLDPSAYTIFIFVCGPWWGAPRILDRFSHCLKIGIDLTLNGSGTLGFDVVIPRDGLGEENPDLALASHNVPVPVVGVALVHPQPFYASRQRHAHVQAVVDAFVASGTVAPLFLDTLLMHNPGKLTTADQFASLVARTDVVLTTRLHGLVFALSSGVPAVAIDPVAGGAKVSAQARALGWPVILPGESLSCDELEAEVHRCASGVLADEVERCRVRALAALDVLKGRFLDAVRSGATGTGLKGPAAL